MESMDDLLNSLIVELKRGTLVISVLSQLFNPEYGYSLVQKLEQKNNPIDAGTLYPLLRRLEKQNLLVSKWDTSETRPRKFYVISEDGKKIFKALTNEWRTLSKQLESLLGEEKDYGND
ncbi:MAG TPA: PadR family transcriptional regulator [Ruminiclostridium sp.]|nr:PadR family transcriptional regulator [Ruminiclostridium sp.]